MKKEYLPEKICACCGLPFTRRKKWEKNWQMVKYCGERCRRQKKVKERDQALLAKQNQIL